MKQWIIKCPLYHKGVCRIKQAPRECNGRYNLLKILSNPRGGCGETKEDQIKKAQLAQYYRIIKESFKIVQESQVLNTRLSRCDIILDKCDKVLAIKPDNTNIIGLKEEIGILKKVLPVEDAEIKADKYEFKQQWKKALDHYQDALYYVERNHITQEDFNGAGLETSATNEPLTIQYIKDKIVSLKEKLEKKT